MCAANRPEIDLRDAAYREIQQSYGIGYNYPAGQDAGNTSTELDAATVEIARLNRVLAELRDLATLSPSDLLIAWRRHCITQKRFGAPDWETGEAGMLRELQRFAVERGR